MSAVVSPRHALPLVAAVAFDVDRRTGGALADMLRPVDQFQARADLVEPGGAHHSACLRKGDRRNNQRAVPVRGAGERSTARECALAGAHEWGNVGRH